MGLPCHSELAVFSHHSLDLVHESVFGVVAGDVEGSVLDVLKLLGLCELDDPGRNRKRAIGSRLIEANSYGFQFLQSATDRRDAQSRVEGEARNRQWVKMRVFAVAVRMYPIRSSYRYLRKLRMYTSLGDRFKTSQRDWPSRT